MKLFAFLLSMLVSVPLLYSQEKVPTPLKSLSIDFDKDDVKWDLQHRAGNAQKIIAEFTPKGQKIRAWKEMVAHEITFTKDSLKEHYDKWKKMVKGADPKIVLKEATSTDENIVVIYQSIAFNEYAIRRFIKAPDGIYALAYHTRLNTYNKDRVLLWTKIIPASKLAANPLLQKDKKRE